MIQRKQGDRSTTHSRTVALGEQLGEVLREALAESLHLRDAAVLDAGNCNTASGALTTKHTA